MTLEQFKELVKSYEDCLRCNHPTTDEHMRHWAHEIAMNAMDVLKAVGESGYREGCEDTINELSSSLLPGAVRYSHEYKWHKSDTKKRLDNE